MSIFFSFAEKPKLTKLLIANAAPATGNKTRTLTQVRAMQRIIYELHTRLHLEYNTKIDFRDENNMALLNTASLLGLA